MNNQDIRYKISIYEQEIDTCYDNIAELEKDINKLTDYKEKASIKLNECYDILDERNGRLFKIIKFKDCNYVRHYIEDMNDIIHGVKAQNVLDNIEDIVIKIDNTVSKKQDLIDEYKNRISACSSQIFYLNSCISSEEEV